MKKPAKKRRVGKGGAAYAPAPIERGTKPRRSTAHFTLRIASFKVESASLVFVARDPKGKVLFRHTVGISNVEGL